MKKVYLDSSFLISWQIKDHPFQKKAQRILQRLNKQNIIFCLSPLAIDEYLYGVNKYLKKELISSKEQIKKSLENILQLTNDYLQINWNQQTSPKIYQLTEKFSLKPRDAFHLQTMKDNEAIFIATFDQDFNKVIKQTKIKNAQKLIN